MKKIIKTILLTLVVSLNLHAITSVATSFDQLKSSESVLIENTSTMILLHDRLTLSMHHQNIIALKNELTNLVCKKIVVTKPITFIYLYKDGSIAITVNDCD